jgi:cytochrome b
MKSQHTKLSNQSVLYVKVWDLGVRVFHWCLVLCWFGAYFLAEENRDWHEYCGYAVLALIAFRLIWGFVGGRYARFADFFPFPSRLLPYLKLLIKGKEPRHVGHNPAAAVMIFFLIFACLGIGVSGYLMTTDWGWGSEILEEIHIWLVDVTLVAVGIHVVAAIYESIRHKENLIRAMLTGKKRR